MAEGSTEIVAAIDRLARVLAAIYLERSGKTKQVEHIEALRRCGFSPKEIADILNTSQGTVAVALHGLKRKKKTKRGRAK